MSTRVQIDALKKYEAQKYDRKTLRFPKGSLEKLTALANADGVSLQRYMLLALEEKSGLKLTLDNALPWLKK